MKTGKRLFSWLLVLALCLAPVVSVRAVDIGVQPERSLCCGDEFAAVIQPDGSLWMWGKNTSGQLGDGTKKSKDTPVKVLDNVASVVCSDVCTAAIKTDGSLWMWGMYPGCVEGNDSVISSVVGIKTPVQTLPVKVMDGVISVGLGQKFAAVVKDDGSLWTWGENEHGQLGNAREKDQTEPVYVMDDAVFVSCGYEHAAAIKTDGTLWTWGLNGDGQLGNGKSTYQLALPEKVMDKVAQVSCGANFTAAVKTDGTLWAWGQNDRGQLGVNIAYSYKPVQVMENAAQVSCGEIHAAAVKTDGSLWTWGGAEKQSSSGLMDIPLPINQAVGVSAVECGKDSTIAVKSTGRLLVLENRVLKAPEMIVRDPAAAQEPEPAPVPTELSVTVSGKPVVWTDAKPFIDANNRTMVPLRAVGDALGLHVGWDGNAREASFSKDGKTIYFPIDSAIARTGDGKFIEMDTAAVIVNDRTYAPVRYLAEYFGYTVSWDGATLTVVIE